MSRIGPAADARRSGYPTTPPMSGSLIALGRRDRDAASQRRQELKGFRELKYQVASFEINIETKADNRA